MLETIFGPTITLSSGRITPTRYVGEQHVQQDLGFIPSLADWMQRDPPVARRIVDRRVLHSVEMWLDCPVEETDERGRKTQTTEARDSRPWMGRAGCLEDRPNRAAPQGR